MIEIKDILPVEEKILKDIDFDAVPKHIAIIMDGNGRYATRQGQERIFGHIAGVETVRRVSLACEELGVKVLTLYTFSAENWSRSEKEVLGLMSLIEEQLRVETEELHKKNVKIVHLGRMDKLPQTTQDTLNESMEITKNNTKMVMQFAINYSGRHEIVDAAKKIAGMAKSGQINIEDIDESLISQNMYNPQVPDPDLVIRTAGEMRVSNYLLWEIAYSEFWITDILWPEFDRLTLLRAIKDYQSRTRKFGAVVENK